MNCYNIKVEFRITGVQLPPDEITDAMNIKPSRQWSIGDSVQNSLIKRECNGWCLLPSVIGVEIEEQILSIINDIKSKTEIINSISQKYDLEFEFACSVDIVKNEFPPLNFSADTIRQISELGASIDIDIMKG